MTTLTYRAVTIFAGDRARYTRGPWLAVTRSTRDGMYALQWYWSDGRGGHRYNPPLPGHRYKRRKNAELAKRQILDVGERPELVEWPIRKEARR